MPHLIFKSNKGVPSYETLLDSCEFWRKIKFYCAVPGSLNHTKYKFTPSPEFSRSQL